MPAATHGSNFLYMLFTTGNHLLSCSILATSKTKNYGKDAKREIIYFALGKNSEVTEQLNRMERGPL